MGIYMNPGNQRFRMAVNSEIFVDKTEMIRYLNTVINTNQRYISVSRPRRFGKTMAADMLCAYYDREADSRTLFADKKVAKETSDIQQTVDWDAYLGKFDVIRIVMTDFIKKDLSVPEALHRLTKRLLDDLEEAYPTVKYDASDFFYSLDRFYRKSGNPFVIVIDEWDVVFRVRKVDKDGQTQYLDFLRDWMKDREYIALAYMTGILPIKKYGEHSALNMFTEYSMTTPMQLARYTGFTEEEVSNLCKRYGRDFEKIRDWYDGYEVSDIVPPDPDHEMLKETGEGPKAKRYPLYSPLSVVNAMSTGFIRNYWNKTETYEALAEYIRKDFDGLKDAVALLMDGGRLSIDISGYQNDMTTFHNRDDVLSLLIHLGYLGYDDERREIFIPNREILDEFKTSTKSDEWIDTFRSFQFSQKLLQATWDCDENKVAELLEDAHDRTGNKTYNSFRVVAPRGCARILRGNMSAELTKILHQVSQERDLNNEAALSYAIQLAYYAAQKYYTTILELDTGKGYADIVYLPAPKYPDIPALLIELKYEKDADTAMDQIRRQKYPDRLEHYKGNLLLVGINYDKEIKNDSLKFKHHSCKIERA